MTLAATSLDDNSAIFLRRSLENGTAILFTGAGFSRTALNRIGHPIPLGSELRAPLWEVAFPGEPFDPGASLGDVFDAALRTAQSRTRAVLTDWLTTDPAAVPEMYADFLRVPWYRIYTLNMDDLIDATQRRFTIDTEITAVSAVSDELPAPDRLTAIHMNGRLSDFPQLTFSAPQYGERTASQEIIYPLMVRELATHCTVFIGTQLDEPPLWHHLMMRGRRRPGRELRPKSFLVARSLSPARRVLLEQYNVRYIAQDTEQFWEEFVRPVAEKRLARPKLQTPLGEPYDNVAAMRSQPAVGAADFLLGREPDWADIEEGYAVARDFETAAWADIRGRKPRVVFVTGTAGSGKSTTLRRLTLALQSEGKKALWPRQEAAHSLPQLRTAANAAQAEVVAIDQSERFGRRALELVRGLAEADEQRIVLVGIAGTAFDDFGMEAACADLGSMTVSVPNLTDPDIDALLDALTKANRLGQLAGQARDVQFRAFQQRAGRQLLVALLEATSGRRFEDKIEIECNALSGDLTTAYAVLALATSHRYPLKVEDLLAALSDVTLEGLSVVDRLARQHLILRTRQSQLVVRHPVIARQVVTHYRVSGQLSEAIARLAFVMASKFYADMPRTPERRLLTDLISHQYLGQVIDSVANVRELYQDVEGLLSNDANYWLQRGSYELERGDTNLAENFLLQARALSGKSYMVQTEWAYLMLRRACDAPHDIRANDWANEGIGVLFTVISESGKGSPHTYVILARYSLNWAKVSTLSFEEKRALLGSVRAAMTEGSRFHAMNRQFKEARAELEQGYLMLAVG